MNKKINLKDKDSKELIIIGNNKLLLMKDDYKMNCCKKFNGVRANCSSSKCFFWFEYGKKNEKWLKIFLNLYTLFF